MTGFQPTGHRVNRLEIEIAFCDAARSDDRAVCAVELGDNAPDWIELIPAGRFTPRDSREPWVNDRPQDVIAATAALGVDPVVDYDHQTEYVDKTGQPARAAGWIKELQVRQGAIWGRVEWTAPGKAALAAREYRYLSPVFNFAKDGRRVVRLLRAALTNNPALHLTALARKESEMDELLKQLRQLLGLDDKADEKAIASAITTLKTQAGVSLTAIAKAAGLKEGASATEIETAVASAVAAGKAGAGEIDPSKYVPRAEFDQVATALATLQKDGAEEKATAAADKAIEEGKITPAQRDWAVAYARKDPEGFKAYADKAPVIVKPGARPAQKTVDANAALTEDELAVCRVTGIDPEKFKATRKAIAEHEEAR